MHTIEISLASLPDQRCCFRIANIVSALWASRTWQHQLVHCLWRFTASWLESNCFYAGAGGRVPCSSSDGGGCSRDASLGGVALSLWISSSWSQTGLILWVLARLAASHHLWMVDLVVLFFICSFQFIMTILRSISEGRVKATASILSYLRTNTTYSVLSAN